MTSPQQAAAARVNGAKSQGPVTPEGKAKAAANSRKHGLCAKEFVLETAEDQTRFAELERELRFTYQAKNPLEMEACHHLAVAIWRRRVCDNLEKELLLAIQRGEACAVVGGDGLPGLGAICRYRARIARDLKDAKAELAELRAARVKAFEAEMTKAKEMTDKTLLKGLVQAIGPQAFASFRSAVSNEPKQLEKIEKSTGCQEIETKQQAKRKAQNEAQKKARKVTRDNRK